VEVLGTLPGHLRAATEHPLAWWARHGVPDEPAGRNRDVPGDDLIARNAVSSWSSAGSGRPCRSRRPGCALGSCRSRRPGCALGSCRSRRSSGSRRSHRPGCARGSCRSRRPGCAWRSCRSWRTSGSWRSCRSCRSGRSRGSGRSNEHVAVAFLDMPAHVAAVLPAAVMGKYGGSRPDHHEARHHDACEPRSQMEPPA
jgi:hypothetical protein